MRVWIDQDLCTGDGLCAEICPEIFYMHDDGLAYVKEEADQNWNPPKYEMGEGTVPFGSSPEQVEAVIESADECPGECIFIEVD